MRYQLFAAALGWVLLGCSAGPDDPGILYMPEMFVSVPYDAHDPNPVLPNGTTLQAPPEGTIARGQTPYYYSAEEVEAAAEVENPIANDPAAIARGQVVFNTFCAVCHGSQADGNGTNVAPFIGFSLKVDRIQGMSDGQLFHIVTHGGPNVMPSYSSQILTDDRWRAIHYLRSLQGVTDRVVDQQAVEPAPETAVEADVGANVDAAEPSPSAEPIEASPSAEPIEASPSAEPIEASPSAEPIEASPSAEPIEASPSADANEPNPPRRAIRSRPRPDPTQPADVQEGTDTLQGDAP